MKTSITLKSAVWSLVLSAIGVAPLGAQTFQQLGSDIVGSGQNDKIGQSIALSSSGNAMVVAAPRKTGGPSSIFWNGLVQVYDWNSGSSAWVQRGQDLWGQDGAQSLFGNAVTISDNGNTIAVSSGMTSGGKEGNVRVYDWNSSSASWVQRGSAVTGENADDAFGSQLALSADGNVFVAGSQTNSSAFSNAGHARVHYWDATTSTWLQRGSDIDGLAVNDAAGKVSISDNGNTVAIGSTSASAGPGMNNRGSVRVLDWNSTSNAWVQRGSAMFGTQQQGLFGAAVALSSDGNAVFVGSPYKTVNTVTAVGQVYRFDWNSGSSTWNLSHTISGKSEEWFGISLAVSSDKNILAVGALFNDDLGNDRGAVRVYSFNGSSYGQIGTEIYGPGNDDQMGSAVAMSASGSIVAVGAPGYNLSVSTTDRDKGLVQVYRSSCLFGTAVWDGGGSDDKYSTRQNWVGDLCPCKGVKLVFNSTGTNTKNCEVDSSISLSSITLNRGYRGRLIVNDTCKLTLDSLTTNAPMVLFAVGAKKADIGVVNISNNGVVNCAANAGINVTRLNLGLAGFVSFRSKSSINVGSLWMDEYSQFKGPQDGNIYLTGHLTIANRTTFDAANAKLQFTGMTNQNVDVFGVNQLNSTPIVVNKSNGAVVLLRNLNSGNLTLTSGNINTGLNTLTLTSASGIFSGGSSSYINGKVALDHNTAWPGSKFRIPLGNASKYRPITLHNTSTSNAWAVEFVDSDPNTLGSVAAPLDGISTDGYWTANRTAGGGGLLADATYFEISDAGKGSWNDADLRVARLATTWNDLGGSYLTASVISTNTSLNTNDNFSIALGVDNATPAPGIVIDREVVSGNEIATSKSFQQEAAFKGQQIAFGVYPNPVSENLLISLSGSDKGSVLLSDMSGKVIGIYNVAETRSISVRNLSAGVYFATYTNGVNRITQRVVRN